jgi:hypothetical protein
VAGVASATTHSNRGRNRPIEFSSQLGKDGTHVSSTGHTISPGIFALSFARFRLLVPRSRSRIEATARRETIHPQLVDGQKLRI